MKTPIGFMWVLAVAAALYFAAPVSAHETRDNAPDTPQASGTGIANMSDTGLANATLRNPTCGAHNGPDGIHPVGNP